MLPRHTLQLRLYASLLLGRWSEAWLGFGLARLCLLGLLLWATVGLAQAHDVSSSGLAQAHAPASRPNPLAESLTQELITLSTRHQQVGPAEQAQLLQDLLTVASERQELLAALIEDDPGEVLRVAIPADLRASLPAEVQGLVEEELEVEGELEVLHEDRDVGSRYLYFLKAAGKRFSLHFATEPPTLLSGSQVHVTGSRIKETLALDSSSTGVQTLASAAPPNTFGAQATLVILVNFQDQPTTPYTVADAQNMFFGPVNNFFMENSYGQTSITGTVVGWYTIPDSITTCNMSQIATDAQNAAVAAGTNLSNYTRYVYAFPYNRVCGWAGSSSVGGNPSQSWINGNSLDLHIIDHELGHAFGLWHSHLLDCGTTASIGSNCAVPEYGDLLDTMGVPQTASPDYNAFQKERLGWLNYGASPSIETVQTSGTYTINPYELGGSGPNALKILKSTDPTTGAKTWYYLEARQAIGFDAFLTNSIYYTQNETTGVLFHIGTDGNGNTSDLLDMTPATPTSTGWYDPSLVPGQSFQDPAAGVTFTTEWVTSAGAAVSVQFSKQTVDALTVATNQTNYNPGQTVSITATATYMGSPAANVSVRFAVTKANGSQVTGSATTGKNGSAVYKLRLKQTDPAGTYMVGANATIQGNVLSATTQFTVQ